MNQTRPEIQNILSRLRRWIRRYVLIQGLAGTVVLACLLFWLTFGIDLAYFRLSNLELPGWFRIACTIAMAAALVGMVSTWVGSKLFRRLKPADLALALERKFPELNDRLITAVELADRSPDGPHSRMLDKTIDEAVSRLSSIRLQETTNPVPLRRMLVAAGVLATSVLVLGIANAQGMERWYNAYILGRNDYWEPFRRNELKVHVVAQPGDRIRNFDENGIYKHPRGADLQLVATVPSEATPPQRVTLQFMSYGGSGQQRGQVTMSRLGEDEFRHPFIRVVNDHELWFRGGDYVNRRPFRVQVVDPPRVDALELKCDYPSYTGLDSLEDQLVRVVGTQVSLPMETSFELKAAVNKPLRQVILRSSDYELSFGFDPSSQGKTPSPTRLTITDNDTGAVRSLVLQESVETFLDQSKKRFQIPLKVTSRAKDEIAKFTETAPFPLPVTPDDTLQITLEDEDEIYSPEPAMLTVNGIVDQSPVVETRRTGIGTAVTRMATIPIEGVLLDDYGVESAWFTYRTDKAEKDERQDLARAPSGQKEFRLQQTSDRNVEYFNLIPLQLDEGQKLTLSVSARDGDTLNGPHESHGELFTFQIVSTDELLAKLADREMTLRARFEQIRTEVNDLRSSLEKMQTQISELETSGQKNDQSAGVVAGYVDRGLHQIRKNHTESRSIEFSFRDLREEMVNNRVGTTELLERIERRVIEPLSLVNQNDFLAVDRLLGTLKLAVERQQGMQAAAGEILPAVDRLLAQMDAILAEMKDRGTLNDVIQNLQKMIELQEQLLEETENKRIEESFFTPLN
ncbi:hypothetical protein SH661x_000462 [Planctomicrobium sp. SH661]|uniref:hypothetical protein n=1 Tax=Planctomicrobium sp. SH661 TaxID=3448124 RepID=UPI003F5BF277